MKERNIIKALYEYAARKGHLYFSSNTTAIPGVGEADFLSINKSMFITEYEIKTSRSDFKADFRNKSNKHMRMDKGLIKRTIYCYKNGWQTEMDENGNSIHKEINVVSKPFVNYFYFACPEDLIKPEEVPI